MKRGVEVWQAFDRTGTWCLHIKKRKGTLSLEEITEAAREYEEDFYAVIIKAVSDDMMQYFDEIETGDYVTLYRATEFLECR